jgi:hypothetical protein
MQPVASNNCPQPLRNVKFTYLLSSSKYPSLAMHLGAKIGTVLAKGKKNKRKIVLDADDSVLPVKGIG